MIARKEIDQAVAYSNALQNPDDIGAVYSNVFGVLVEDGDVNRAWEMLSRGKDLVANGSKAQHPTALLTLALAALKVKPAMGFELARAAIISLNRAYETKETDDKQYSNAALKLEASMLLFGTVDFEQSLGLAGLVVDKTLSMQSTIEVCRSVIVRQQGRHSAK